MVSALTPERTPDGLSLLAALPRLAFELDVSAPVALPAARRAPDAISWPFPVAGPSVAPEEPLDAFIKRRYQETLLLGETLSPLAGFVADLNRAGSAHSEAICASISQHMMGLSAIEARHRRVLGPVVAAILASGGSAASAVKVLEAFRVAGLDDAERAAFNTAVELRAKARSVVEGEQSLVPRQITDELERREVLIQVVFLLVYRQHPHPPPKKRKRKKDKAGEQRPEDDTDAALELLADRIGVWAAVAELGIGAPLVEKKRPGQTRETVSSQLKAFWDGVLVANYLPREVAFCTSFHAKVFGTPIPQHLVPQKKPRKPKVTHKLEVERSSARAPQASVPLRRTNSRVEDGGSNAQDTLPPRIFKRAQSGGLKMREVSFRRTNSKSQSQSQSQSTSTSQTQSGLLGRNLSKTGSSSAPDRPQAPLILATPAKKTHNVFARHHPTPIQEEPSSGGYGGYGYVAETPHTSRFTGVAETPGFGYTPLPFAAETPQKNDEFGDLMVPTDDEDEPLVPETPRR